MVFVSNGGGEGFGSPGGGTASSYIIGKGSTVMTQETQQNCAQRAEAMAGADAAP